MYIIFLIFLLINAISVYHLQQKMHDINPAKSSWLYHGCAVNCPSLCEHVHTYQQCKEKLEDLSQEQNPQHLRHKYIQYHSLEHLSLS